MQIVKIANKLAVIRMKNRTAILRRRGQAPIKRRIAELKRQLQNNLGHRWYADQAISELLILSRGLR